MDIRDGITQLMFKCELSGITSAKYTVYALVLNEQETKLRNENSKLILSAEMSNLISEFMRTIQRLLFFKVI